MGDWIGRSRRATKLLFVFKILMTEEEKEQQFAFKEEVDLVTEENDISEDIVGRIKKRCMTKRGNQLPYLKQL